MDSFLVESVCPDTGLTGQIRDPCLSGLDSVSGARELSPAIGMISILLALWPRFLN